jgi:hypothetical protein
LNRLLLLLQLLQDRLLAEKPLPKNNHLLMLS